MFVVYCPQGMLMTGAVWAIMLVVQLVSSIMHTFESVEYKYKLIL
jgi:hypothetical protein